MTPIWKYCLAKFYFINLSIHQDPKNSRRVPFKIQKFEPFSLVSLSIHPCSRRGAERIRQGEGRWSRPPQTALERSDLTEKFQFQASHTEAETNKSPDRKKKNDHIYVYVFFSNIDMYRYPGLEFQNRMLLVLLLLLLLLFSH